MKSGANRSVRWTITSLSVLAVLAAASCAAGSDSSQAVDGFPAGSEVFDGEGNSLGSIAFTTTCSAEANELVRRGLGLLHHMTYTQAERAFRTASEADATCALSYWGRALTLVHPLWPDVPSDEAFQTGWELLEKAREVGTSDPRESAYIAALQSYYRDGSMRAESARLATYAESWSAVSADYPRDPEAALFRALTLMATASDADKTHSVRESAGRIAEEVLAAIPDHPGAHHYVIHAYDVPPLANRALAVARNYGAVAPDNAHALHMTSHIFTRVGYWEESIFFNERSAAVALDEPINGAVSFHHLHAVDYLAYAHLQRADAARAQSVLDHLRGLEGSIANHPASAYAFAAVPARIALEQQRWGEAAEVPVRWPATVAWDSYPQFEAIPVFSRGLGAARSGDFAAASAAVARLEDLRYASQELPVAYDWATQVEIQEIAVRAWIAYGQGRSDEALVLMSQAADLEATTEKNPVTPGEVLPARELLGDMLLENGRFADAVAAYRGAMVRSPGRLNSLFGAGRASELAGDGIGARSYYEQLLDGAAENSESQQVAHAREFVNTQ